MNVGMSWQEQKRTDFVSPFSCHTFSNFDLSSTMFAQTKRQKKFYVAFSKATARAAQAQNARFLFAKLFLLGLFSQKKKRYRRFDTKSF